MNEEMEKQLASARQENEKLSSVMGALGVSARPTVAQWLQHKQMERKAKLQDSLISWDRGEFDSVSYSDCKTGMRYAANLVQSKL